jgi:hypothetical protein
MTERTVAVFPDVELELIYILTPMAGGAIRFVTVLPKQFDAITVRVHRTTGTPRSIGVDRPIVDIDVFGKQTEQAEVSWVSRGIQADISSLHGTSGLRGVIQSVLVTMGSRLMLEDNPDIVRYGSTYEVFVRPKGESE